MSIENTLRFLETASKFDIESLGDDDFEVRLRDSEIDLMAQYHDGLWDYYITDCYNSGTDEIPIDIEELDELRDFCQILSRGI